VDTTWKPQSIHTSQPSPLTNTRTTKRQRGDIAIQRNALNAGQGFITSPYRNMNNHVDTASPLTHISLCAGYGGIDLGLARAIPNIRTIAFSEIEAFACANLVSKMEAGLLDCAPIWTDLKTFPWDQFCGKVDIISGGFPCQPFSCAGKRNGDEDPRHLFPYILDGIRRCRPSIVFLENVEGIISSKLNGEGWNDPAGTPVLLHVLRELERVGYKTTAGVFSASECRAPHQRKRVFIMAHNLSERGKELTRKIPVKSQYPPPRNCGIIGRLYKQRKPDKDSKTGAGA